MVQEFHNCHYWFRFTRLVSGFPQSCRYAQKTQRLEQHTDTEYFYNSDLLLFQFETSI
jgi:hypothetical protein